MTGFRKAIFVVPIAAIALFGVARLTLASGATSEATLPFAVQPYVLGDAIDDYAWHAFYPDSEFAGRPA